MEVDTITWNQSNELHDIIYHYFKIPADLQKAELHGLAYRVYEKPQEYSVQCKCCNYYKDHIKFNCCGDLSIQDDHFVANDYFQTIKWMLLQLTILCTVFVPFALYFNKQGDGCEKHPNCDVNSLKIYSIWNLITTDQSLENLMYAGVIFSTQIILIISIKCGSCDIMAAKALKSIMLMIILIQGIYIPNKIEDEEILEFLDTQMCFQIYRVNFKYYEDLLFEKLKFPYLRDKTQQKKIVLREVFEGNEDIKQTFKQSYLIFPSDDLLIEQEIHQDFIKLCEENDQKIYHGKQIGSPSFQFVIQIVIIYTFSYFSILTQFAILKIRYDFINTHYNGEEDQMIRQLLNVGFTLLSMIALKIFDQIGSKILTRLASVIYHLSIGFQMVMLQSLDLRYWHVFIFDHIFEQSSETMLQNEGMLDYLITLSQLNLIVPIITQIFDYKSIWKKIKLSRLKRKKNNNKIQMEANLLFQLREFNFYERQATVYKIFVVSMIFGYQYPLIIPFSMLSLLLIYWLDKYIFINYSIPAKKDRYYELIQSVYFAFNMMQLIFFLAFCYQFFKTWYYKILFIIFFIFLLCILYTSLEHQDYNAKAILSEFVEKQYQISNDEKYQLFINLQKRLKKFAKKQKKNQVVEAANLLE